LFSGIQQPFLNESFKKDFLIKTLAHGGEGKRNFIPFETVLKNYEYNETNY